MHNIFSILQIIFSVILIIFILMQAQGSGLRSTWNGGGETYHTRRGLEKVIFYATIVGIALFAIASILAAINQ